MSSLTRIVPWSQQLACEVLLPGDLAVDLTAGKGRDACAMAKAVGPDGQVVAFDLQTSALEQTAELLGRHGFAVKSWPADQSLPKEPGVYLVHACHSSLDKMLHHFPKAIMANLGYLPGGDKSLVTRSETTLAALQQAVALLAPGGRLAVTVYPVHPGGAEEGAAVDELFSNLHRNQWQVLSLRAENQSEAPYLMVAERLF
jgi:hypothetical protein